jgi:hypothetical protein
VHVYVLHLHSTPGGVGVGVGQRLWSGPRSSDPSGPRRAASASRRGSPARSAVVLYHPWSVPWIRRDSVQMEHLEPHTVATRIILCNSVSLLGAIVIDRSHNF